MKKHFPIKRDFFSRTVGHVSFDIAYIAHNKPAEAYFVIQAPTSVTPGQADAPQVTHYSRIVGMPVINHLIAL